MRSFANFIALGNIFDEAPEGAAEIRNMYNRVFKPVVTIVEENCGTKLGSIENILQGSSFIQPECPRCEEDTVITSSVVPIVGKIDLRGTRKTSPPILPDTVITAETVNKYRALGEYYIHVRDLPTCVSKGGVCRKCLWASGRISTTLGDIPAVGSKVVLDFTDDPTPFLSYLAKSYSGSLIGMKSYSGVKLPLREGLYEETLLKQTFITSFYRKVSDSGLVSAIDLQYALDIGSSLEKVLYILAQYQFSSALNTV